MFYINQSHGQLEQIKKIHSSNMSLHLKMRHWLEELLLVQIGHDFAKARYKGLFHINLEGT